MSVIAVALVAGSLATGGVASAADNRPCAANQVYRASHWVQYCPLTRAGVPVYANAYSGNGAARVGTLIRGGSANWFVGQSRNSTFSLGTALNNWWAYTQADNGRWGWVPEVYFSGGLNYEKDARLKDCFTGPPIYIYHCK